MIMMPTAVSALTTLLRKDPVGIKNLEDYAKHNSTHPAPSHRYDTLRVFPFAGMESFRFCRFWGAYV